MYIYGIGRRIWRISISERAADYISFSQQKMTFSQNNIQKSIFHRIRWWKSRVDFIGIFSLGVDFLNYFHAGPTIQLRGMLVASLIIWKFNVKLLSEQCNQVDDRDELGTIRLLLAIKKRNKNIKEQQLLTCTIDKDDFT